MNSRSDIDSDEHVSKDSGVPFPIDTPTRHVQKRTDQVLAIRGIKRDDRGDPVNQKPGIISAIGYPSMA